MADIKRNILGEGFLPYVKKQIEIRQQVLSPTSRYSPDILKYMTTKTPWVKLTSGVNVSEAKAKELGVPGYAGSQLAKASILEAGKKYYGVSVDDTDQNGNPVQSDHSFTRGVDPTDIFTAYGYTPGVGAPSLAVSILDDQFNTIYPSDFTAYGRSPVPGITSVDIKPIGQQGTVREATIQIICHNLAQFKIIDALYLRLKFSILLEWGHSIYFDNNKQLVTNPFLDEANNYFISEGNTQDVILSKIEKQRQESCGNYDGFLGYVTNFTWTYRKDGGYDITLHARSAGDVIESIKVNANYPGGTATVLTKGDLNTEEQKYLSEQAQQQENADLTQIVPSVIANKNRSTLNQILFGIKRLMDDIFTTPVSIDGFGNSGISSVPEGASILGTTNIPLWAKTYSNYNLSQPNFVRKEEDPAKENHLLVKQEAYKVIFNNITTAPDETATGGAFYYIKLGTLLRIIESFLLKYDTTRSDSTFGTGNSYAPLFYIDYDYDENVCFIIPRLVSSDPKVCLIKPTGLVASTSTDSSTTQIPITVYQVYDDVVPKASGFNPEVDPKYQKLIDVNPSVISEDEYNLVNLGNRLYVTDDPNVTEEPLSDGEVLPASEVAKLNEQFGETFDTLDQFGTSTTVQLIRRRRYVKTSATPSQIAELEATGGILASIEPGYRTSFPFLGKFMHTLVNIDFISSTIVNNIDKDGNISIFEFIQAILNGIQAATGYINDFKVVYNENANILYIQDYNIPPEQMKYVKSLNASKKYSNNSPDSTPTKLNINLVKDTSEQDSAFNGRGSFVTDVQIKTELTNNFATQITVAAQASANKVGTDAVAISRLNVGYTDRIVKKKSSKGDDDIDDLKSVVAYSDNLQLRSTLISNIDNGEVNDNDINTAKQALVDLYKYEMGQYTKNNNIQGKGFIPVNLNLTMDGLSGIKLFEAYTINDEILPSNYRNAIRFINRGVTHKIDDKGWITMLDSLGGPDSKTLTPLQEEFETPLQTTVSSTTEVTEVTESGDKCGKVKTKSFTTTPNLGDWKEAIAQYLRKNEGLTEVASYDQNKYRAGYGSDKIIKNGKTVDVAPNMTVTKAEAEDTLYNYSIPTYENSIIKQLGGQGNWTKLTNNQKFALFSLVYNAGPNSLNYTGIANAIKNNNYTLAGNLFYDKGPVTGAKDGYLSGLERRRKEESIIFLTPDATAKTVSFPIPGKRCK
jgi:GH24 family phage-related lysozyme (muramidase)